MWLTDELKLQKVPIENDPLPSLSVQHGFLFCMIKYKSSISIFFHSRHTAGNVPVIMLLAAAGQYLLMSTSPIEG